MCYDAFVELLDHFIKFATLRPRSEFELQRWLIRKKIDSETTQQLIATLQKLNLVDDRAFVRWWIAQRLEFRPKSHALLIRELRQKGVDKELISTVVSELTQELPSDEELAFQSVEKRRRIFDRFDQPTRKQKITNFLAGRGFGWSVIKKIVSNY